MANGRLTPVLINKARAGQAAPGKYSDGQNGLRLAVARSGAASWVMRFMHNSRRHDHGLGSLQWIGLSKARELAAAKLSALKVDKIDPLGERREGRMSDLRFGKAAEDFIEANKAGWKDPRAVDTWTNSLRDHAGALFPKRVCEITTDDVYGVLAPIWATLNPTAVRLRGRIEAVLAWAKVKGHRDGANPAAWKDNLAAMLPKPKAVKRTVKHHKAVPFADLPVVYSRLAASDDAIAVMIRFCLLTASRPSEAMGARWREIDFKAATWTVPPERMKKDKLHVVPLSHEALDLLRRLPGGRRVGDELVFAQSWGSDWLRVLRASAGMSDATLHGTSRSGFADWAATEGYADRLIDYSLAHYPSDMTAAAYKREGLVEQRREPMARWSQFLATAEAQSGPMRTSAAAG